MSVSEGGVEGSFWIVLAGLSSRFVFRSWREIPVLVDWGFAIFVRYSFIVFGGWRREEGFVKYQFYSYGSTWGILLRRNLIEIFICP